MPLKDIQPNNMSNAKQTHKAAVITGSRNPKNLTVIKEVPLPELEDNTILIKSVAHAANPTDWKHIYSENFVSFMLSGLFGKLGLGFHGPQRVFSFLGASIGSQLGKLATQFQKDKISGSDFSGIVEDVGKNVTGFKKGDFVSASVHGGYYTTNGGFAEYVVASVNGAINWSKSQIDETPLKPGSYPAGKVTSFEAAASVPIGIKTAAISFYSHLGIPIDKSKNKDDYVLIWGGATATGIIAIQVAKIVFGIKVITTASKKNHDLLKALGADEIFDYKDADVVDQVRKAGNGHIKYALDCVSSIKTFQAVYDATEGSDDVRIDNLLFLDQTLIVTKPKRDVKFFITHAYLVDGKTHFGSTATPELLKSFEDFWTNILPLILDKIQAAPLEVLDPGFGSVNKALELLRNDKVSGAKIVFRTHL